MKIGDPVRKNSKRIDTAFSASIILIQEEILMIMITAIRDQTTESLFLKHDPIFNDARD